LLAHQFLGVQTAIGTAETYVALARNLPGHPVIRHIVSFDAKIARHGRLAAARHLAPVPAPVPRSLPARRGAPACRERRCSFDYRRGLLHPGSAAGRTTSLRLVMTPLGGAPLPLTLPPPRLSPPSPPSPWVACCLP